MIRYFIITWLLIICLINNFAGTIITGKEKIIIHDKALTLVKDYENNINKIGIEITDVIKTKGNIEKFIDLFVNRKTMVYNDLDPSHQLSEFYEIETYASNLALWYPDGQSVTLDLNTATASDIMEHGDNIFSIDIVVSKKIKGNYLNQTINNNSEKLLIRVAFVMENGKSDKFKIAGIRNATGEIKSLDNLSIAEVKSIDLDKNALLKIQSNCKSLANDYSNYLTLIGNESESADDKEMYKNALKNIFIDRENNIYNDLEDNPNDKYVSIDQYIQKYSEIYPSINNISLNADSATFSKVIKTNDTLYTLYMYTNKFFSAKQKGRSLYRFQEKMILKINFTQQKGTFTHFKIESIDNQGINEALSGTDTKTQNINTFNILPKLTRKGMYLSLNLNAGFSNIVNKNIAELDMNTHSHEWEISPKLSYGGELRILLMFNDAFGFETGLGFQNLSAKYSISSKNITADPALVDSTGLNAFVDKNPYPLNIGDTYYKILQIPNYDSTINLQTITIPLYFNACFGHPKKISFNIKAGLEIMYILKASYSVSGEKKYFAYLPNPLVEYNNFNFVYAKQDVNGVMGLYQKEIDKKDQEAPLKKMAINGVIYGGVNIPLGYFLTINAGIAYKLGFSDLSKSKSNYLDIFGETKQGINASSNHILEYKPTKLQQYYIELGITYKF